MNNLTADRLYNLLPYVYRQRDADQGEPLRALLAVMESQLSAIQADIDGLYDNWFIETCAEWVVPYIGDLLGVHGLYPLSPGVFTQRPYVANTLGYRRRKGTVAVIEQLAHDIAGWPARAVEFFSLLSTTQNVNHVRPASLRTPDLRDTNALELLGGPFEQAAYTVDVRHIDDAQGKYNIPNVGLFLWRLQSYPVTATNPWALASPAGRYTFSPLGNDAPLFNAPQSQAEGEGRPQEQNVPGELRRRALYDELEARRQDLTAGNTPESIYFGENPVLSVYVDGKTLRPEEIQICDLSGWEAPGWQPPASRTYHQPDGTSFATQVGVDPALGRLAFLQGITVKPLQTSYAYGFSGDLGGGPYDRRRLATPPGQPQPTDPDTIANPGALDALIHVPSGAITTLTQALAAWDQHAHPRAVIQIDDSRTYTETLAITFDGGAELVIQAANEQRPVLVGDVTVSRATSIEQLVLNGLLIAGQLQIQDNLGELSISHSTLAPGWTLVAGQPQISDRPSLVVAATNNVLQLQIDHSITGRLLLPTEMTSLTIADSILDSPFGRGPAAYTPALVSGDLTTFPALSSAAPSLTVRIGEDGPKTVVLSPKPTTLESARAALQAAIRAASPSPAFTNSSVVAVDDRLVILPGLPDAITLDAPATHPPDPTLGELRLDAASSLSVMALVSAYLGVFPALTSATPALNVTIGAEGPHPVALTPKPTTLAQTSDELQAAIRAASTSIAFTGAIVGIVGTQLFVLPGASGVAVLFTIAPADSTTLAQLGLATGRPAVAANDAGDQPGPPASLQRVTIFGAVHVRQLTQAAEVIFVDAAVAERHQVGCVRFSYVPDDLSLTPRRYRCQPDSALNGVTDPAQQAAIRMRLEPALTSTRYGDPAYAQLGLACANEIRTGAEDGSEMGGFSFLKQPQRESNLRTALSDYLRFGLETGLFYLA
jgi:hypothetical protein